MRILFILFLITAIPSQAGANDFVTKIFDYFGLTFGESDTANKTVPALYVEAGSLLNKNLCKTKGKFVVNNNLFTISQTDDDFCSFNGLVDCERVIYRNDFFECHTGLEKFGVIKFNQNGTPVTGSIDFRMHRGVLVSKDGHGARRLKK
jgi:hypothetical protein